MGQVLFGLYGLGMAQLLVLIVLGLAYGLAFIVCVILAPWFDIAQTATWIAFLYALTEVSILSLFVTIFAATLFQLADAGKRVGHALGALTVASPILGGAAAILMRHQFGLGVWNMPGVQPLAWLRRWLQVQPLDQFVPATLHVWEGRLYGWTLEMSRTKPGDPIPPDHSIGAFGDFVIQTMIWVITHGFQLIGMGLQLLGMVLWDVAITAAGVAPLIVPALAVTALVAYARVPHAK